MICVEVHSNNVLTVRDNTFDNAVSDSIKHETIKFLFSDNWKDYQKTAVFSAAGVEPINIILNDENELCLAEDECYIPFEVLEGDSFTLSVFGVKGDSLATATPVEIAVLTSGYTLGDAPQEPTPSEYAQIVGIMTETKEIADSVRSDADNGLFKGDKGDKGDKGENGINGVGRSIDLGGEIFNDYENNKADGTNSHAEGLETTASAKNSHAEGYLSRATNSHAHAEGRDTTASGNASHSEGNATVASGDGGSHAEGMQSIAKGMRSHAEGYGTSAQGDNSHSEGSSTTASGMASHSEGDQTQASGRISHAEGFKSVASGEYSHAEGINTQANYVASHAEGSGCIASGGAAHAEGQSTKATGGMGSHAEGWETEASGYHSHAEGSRSIASNSCSHAEGYETKSMGDSTHAEGNLSLAKGQYTHAEGYGTEASNMASHAEGYRTQATGFGSHSSGISTIASGEAQFVCGQSNNNKSGTLFEVGNGKYGGQSNAFEVYLDGHSEVQKVGTSDNSVPTKKYVDDRIYPVGCVYSTNLESFNPQESFGGVWEKKFFKRTILGKIDIQDFEVGTNHITLTEGLYSYKLSELNYALSLTVQSNNPKDIFVSAGEVVTNNGYISSINIVTNSLQSDAFSVFWSLTSDCENDENGCYYWIRMA